MVLEHAGVKHGRGPIGLLQGCPLGQGGHDTGGDALPSQREKENKKGEKKKKKKTDKRKRKREDVLEKKKGKKNRKGNKKGT